MEHLFNKLYLNSKSDIYPYHMPGHKRQAWGELPKDCYSMDITEIDGFDNLHQPEEILADLQNQASLLYGADETFYLVNGSTCGIMSAISAALPPRGKLLMARNAHKSAYHTAYIRNLKVSYICPNLYEDYGYFDAVTPKQVEEALAKDDSIEAVFIVSPTYEGRIADVKAIAEIVHNKKIPLIVDEAHGAHFGLSKEVHENSCRLGADIVIHSVHKTMPALTQSALLHVNGNLVDREMLRRFIHIYQTSSPSYLLMASIDNALQFVQENKDAFRTFRKRFLDLYRNLSLCKYLSYPKFEEDEQDIGKLVISTKNTSITGKQLYDLLLHKYQLQMEMASEKHVLAMFTVNDTDEAYYRLEKALLEIDKSLSYATGNIEEINQFELPTVKIPLGEAWDSKSCNVPLKEAVGRYTTEFVNLYPPGIPILVPGEIITDEICASIMKWKKQGLNVQGIQDSEGKLYIKTGE